MQYWSWFVLVLSNNHKWFNHSITMYNSIRCHYHTLGHTHIQYTVSIECILWEWLCNIWVLPWSWLRDGQTSWRFFSFLLILRKSGSPYQWRNKELDGAFRWVLPLTINLCIGYCACVNFELQFLSHFLIFWSSAFSKYIRRRGKVHQSQCLCWLIHLLLVCGIPAGKRPFSLNQGWVYWQRNQ